MNPEPTKPEHDEDDLPKAHQPDGTDSSDQFDAGIADENMIPE